MLSNAYLLAKCRFDTAENEPAKNLQNLARILNFANLLLLGSGAHAAAQVLLRIRAREEWYKAVRLNAVSRLRSRTK